MVDKVSGSPFAFKKAVTKEVSTATSDEAHKVDISCWNLYRSTADKFRKLDRLLRSQVHQTDESDNSSNDEDTEIADDVQFLTRYLLLRRKKHLQYILKHFISLPSSMFYLDASRGWIVYWLLHSLNLLDAETNAKDQISGIREKVVPFFVNCKDPNGGYGGGFGQIAHLAATYAAIAALFSCQSETALESIDRQAIHNFIKKMQDKETNGFKVHQDGELDVRGLYCAVSVASMLQIITDDLFTDVDVYVQSLQSYDGGFAGEPGVESHGGHTYCAFTSLALLNLYHTIDLRALIYWITNRQTTSCGGFNGRPNKLQDSCYSFWCGGLLSIINQLGHYPNKDNNSQNSSWYNQSALQIYLLACCQESQSELSSYKGGMRDKPEVKPDFYHTCYALSGLSQAQESFCVGPLQNKLKQIDPFYNVTKESIQFGRQYFLARPFTDLNTGKKGTEGKGMLQLLNQVQ